MFSAAPSQHLQFFLLAFFFLHHLFLPQKGEKCQRGGRFQLPYSHTLSFILLNCFQFVEIPDLLLSSSRTPIPITFFKLFFSKSIQHSQRTPFVLRALSMTSYLFAKLFHSGLKSKVETELLGSSKSCRQRHKLNIWNNRSDRIKRAKGYFLTW